MKFPHNTDAWANHLACLATCQDQRDAQIMYDRVVGSVVDARNGLSRITPADLLRASACEPSYRIMFGTEGLS